jgi:hypothetical protein
MLLSAGRYEDELTAAKAYDKAAVYLYVSSANTNFGLLECLQDTTEVSALLLLLLLLWVTGRTVAAVQLSNWLACTGKCPALHLLLLLGSACRTQQRRMSQLLLPLQQHCVTYSHLLQCNEAGETLAGLIADNRLAMNQLLGSAKGTQ